MERIVIHCDNDKLAYVVQLCEGYIRTELSYDVLIWLNTQLIGFWYPDASALSDCIILYFDLEEDAASFKLRWL